MIETAPLECVVHLAGAVRGDDDDGRFLRPDGAEFRDRHLEIREDFEEERLEGLVGAVDFVNEQHGRRPLRRFQRLQQRPLDQELLGEDIVAEALAVEFAGRLRQPDLDHLGGVVPLIDGGIDIQPLVALQPDEPAAKAFRQHLGNLRLADSGFAFEEERAPHAEQRNTTVARSRPAM